MGVASSVMWRLVDWVEYVRCAVFGHRRFDDARFPRIWCTRCKKRWERP